MEFRVEIPGPNIYNIYQKYTHKHTLIDYTHTNYNKL